jgi:hypothetical protein
MFRWESREVTDLMMWRYGKMIILMMKGAGKWEGFGGGA